MAKKIIAKCMLNGYLKYGRWELTLSDEDYKKFAESSEDDKKEWIKEDGKLIVETYSVNDSDIYRIEEDGD